MWVNIPQLHGSYGLGVGRMECLEVFFCCVFFLFWILNIRYCIVFVETCITYCWWKKSCTMWNKYVQHVWTNGCGGEVSLVVKWLGLGHSILMYTPTQTKTTTWRLKMYRKNGWFVCLTFRWTFSVFHVFFPAVWKLIILLLPRGGGIFMLLFGWIVHVGIIQLKGENSTEQWTRKGLLVV